MAQKKINSFSALVYSTDPNFKPEQNIQPENTLSPQEQSLKIRLDKKHRAGKAVTLVEGFAGNDNDANELSKKLKAFCGTGGSYKDGEIIIQGDNRDKILSWLQKNNYSRSKKI
jgi:translation initiation factor 1